MRLKVLFRAYNFITKRMTISEIKIPIDLKLVQGSTYLSEVLS